MNNKILDLNIPGREIEMSRQKAEELGAFEENALSEADAREAIDIEDEQEG
ncbi:hypothetical protein [Candidatus Regiella insecticola]|uniref:Conjugal transfer protein TraD n=1 Tax=Candidatus Regiella insecticola 5.15 TaxID=1005043 RepID=G2GY19_9ENTR|nr:hypothetical protein [Candidatus Regiella insecticola]EGY29361.1 hypothetical protein Rin_00006680 [Candidatus Regiella insecticola 5.15]